eukprot:SM000015S01268  [mRNA]  locus=s15:967143:968851:+ [translate_table: standard]
MAGEIDVVDMASKKSHGSLHRHRGRADHLTKKGNRILPPLRKGRRRAAPDSAGRSKYWLRSSPLNDSKDLTSSCVAVTTSKSDSSRSSAKNGIVSGTKTRYSSLSFSTRSKTALTANSFDRRLSSREHIRTCSHLGQTIDWVKDSNLYMRLTDDDTKDQAYLIIQGLPLDIRPGCKGQLAEARHKRIVHLRDAGYQPPSTLAFNAAFLSPSQGRRRRLDQDLCHNGREEYLKQVIVRKIDKFYNTSASEVPDQN